MHVPPLDLPIEEVRRSLNSLRRPLRIAILRARNPFNVGAIIRVAHSFLVREILLIGDTPYYQRASMGMERYENIVEIPTEADFLTRAHDNDWKLVVFEREHSTADLWNADIPEDCVMVFGSEVAGVTPDILAAAHLVVGIPMYGINHSFPVTVAAGIAMAEWTRRFYS